MQSDRLLDGDLLQASRQKAAAAKVLIVAQEVSKCPVPLLCASWCSRQSSLQTTGCIVTSLAALPLGDRMPAQDSSIVIVIAIAVGNHSYGTS